MASRNTSSSTSSKTSQSKTASKLTAYQKEQIETLKKINEFKEACEANIVAILYKEPDLIRENNIELTEFTNNCWRVYFEIAKEIIITEKKSVLDEVTVGLFLSKHPKLSQKYDEYGGYQIIENAGAYVKIENFYGYLDEMRKWNAVIKLNGRGFGIVDKLKDFCDMTIEDIYREYEVYLNDIFINAGTDVKSYNGFEGMTELIEALDKGAGVGIPFANCEYLNKETGGMIPGEIVGMGASTGVGKSTLSINYIFPSMIKYDLKALFIINEEDQTKFMKEALIWYLSNIEKSPIQKHVLRDGNYDEKTKSLLLKAAKWFEEQKDKRNITIIPLESYTSTMVCKILKKYISLGVDVICLDTLKESSDSRNEETWKALMRDTVDFYNIIKRSKTAMVITYQLTKNRSRYLTVADINASKGIVDVFALNLFFRRPLQDEYKGGKRELSCIAIKGKGNNRVPFSLKEGEHYMICFISKNRRGNSDIQIISKADFSINKYEDLGYCNVVQDF